MRVDLSAVPRLINTEPIPGSGAGRNEYEWAAALAELRPRFMALSYRELCTTLRALEMGDLTGLVISLPFDEALLAKFREGLSAAVFEILAEDCRQYGNALLGADLAFGTFHRSQAALEAIESQRATPAQLEALQPLALQLAAVPNRDWYDTHLTSELLVPLIELTGGLEGVFGQRVKALASERAWEFIAEDHQDNRDEPLSRKLAEQAITGIPLLVAGQPWPFEEEYASEADMDALFKEMETLLGDGSVPPNTAAPD